MRWAIVVSICVACGSEPAKPPPVVAPKPPSGPWAMAPEGVKLGVVASSRALTLLEHAVADVDAFFTKAPDLEPLRTKLHDAIARTGDSTLRLADFGFTSNQAAAVFVVDRAHLVAILPVGDRARFVARLHGTGGADHDTFAFGTCRPVSGFYTCATSDDLFAKLGKADLEPRLGGRHGDLEVVGVELGFPTPHLAVAATVELAPGTATLRAKVTGFPATVREFIGAPAKVRVDRTSAAGFSLIQLGSRGAFAPIVQAVPGLESAISRTAPLTMMVPAGMPAVDVRIPLADPAAVQKLVDSCPSIQALAQLHPTIDRQVCHLHPPNLTADAWIEGRELRIATRPMPAPTPLPLTAAGAELADHEWSVAAWGRGPMIPTALFFVIPFLEDHAFFPGLIHAMLMVNEMGAGLRIDGDTASVFLHIRTLWTNPDDVVDRVARLASVTDLQTFTDLPKSTPFRSDLSAGTLGGITASQIMDLQMPFMLAVAEEATEHIKSYEALKQLHSIRDNLKAHLTAFGAYPVGDIKPSAISCCRGPDHKCPAADWSNPVWTKLQFDIAGPTEYRYGYHSDGKTADVVAVGDLDCDGKEATYTLHMDAAGEMKMTEPPAGLR